MHSFNELGLKLDLEFIPFSSSHVRKMNNWWEDLILQKDE